MVLIQASFKMFAKSLLTLGLALAAQAVEITVKSTGGNATSPLQYGIMFEDINNSGDGGVYAELVQNRAFQGSGVSSTPSTQTRDSIANEPVIA